MGLKDSIKGKYGEDMEHGMEKRGAEKKKIAVIGAGEFQEPLIKKAKEKGLETHVFAWKSGSTGEREADFFYPVSIREKEQILDICRSIQPIGIVSAASDLAVVTVNYVAEEMGLVGNGSKSALISTNKYLMRKVFEKNGDPSPKCCRSDELTDDFINSVNMPLIVKPVDRSGSRGVSKVSERPEIEKAVEEAERVSFDKKAIIEEFIEGKEYSVEYISWEGRHTFLALTEKYTTGGPHFIETGHVQPADISERLLRKVKKVIEHALDSLLIKNGASHSEIKIASDDEIKIIEIGARMGGDCIGSDLVPISTGYDFMGMVIDIACGIKPFFQKTGKGQRAEIRFILSEEDKERLGKAKLTEPERLYRISRIKNINGMNAVTDSSARYGYYIMRGSCSEGKK